MISEVFNCDCLEYMKTLPDKFFDLAIVDPPYSHNSGNAFRSRLKRYGSLDFNDTKPPDNYWLELFRVSHNQIVWGGNYFIDKLYPTKCMLAWYKHQPVETYADIEIAWTSFNERHSQLIDLPYFGTHGSDPKGRIHPNQKPVKLYKKLLFKYATCDTCNNFVQPDCNFVPCYKCNGVMGKIFDSHMGSQSSRIAAYDMGFSYWGCELDPDYFRDGCKRFENHKAQLTLF